MSVDMKKVHDEALKSGMPALHEFMQTYRGAAPEVYAFVEGKEDPLFYRGFIESLIDPAWRVRFIPSGGKKAVREAYADMDWERFSKRRVCFFLDRDLSDFIGDEIQPQSNLYVTDMYSIENEVLDRHALFRILDEVFNISLSADDEEAVANFYFDNLLQFNEIMIPFTAQIVLWRRGGRELFKPNLKNLRLANLFRYQDKRICLVAPYDVEGEFLPTCSAQVQCPLHSEAERAAVEVELRAVYPVYRTLRGKYVFWFFSTSVVVIHTNIHELTQKYDQPPKPRDAFNAGTAMGLVAPRLRVPDSLRQFIANNYCDYIRSVVAPEVGITH